MLNDLSGKKFGRFTVLRRDPVNKRPTKWICRCECGTEKSVFANFLTAGRTKSCGCLRSEMARAKMSAHIEAFTGSQETHGLFGSPAYVSWNAMVQRCTNPNRDNYEFYGGRGIKVCDRWRTFENFVADMGERPEDTTLDRYPDNNGNYEPGNCRWATTAQQAGNRRQRGPNKNPRKRLEATAPPNEVLGRSGERKKTRG